MLQGLWFGGSEFSYQRRNSLERMQSPTLPVILILVLMALLAGGAAWRESVTVDEVAHTGAGVSYLQRLDMRMNEEHPPLAKVVAALPLVLRRAHADYSDVSWTFSGERMFNEYMGEWVFGHWFLMRWNDPLATLRWARFPMLLIMLLMGFVIYKCGARLGGSARGGLLCLTVYATMPVFLAFGPLVITDIMVTLFWILAVWQLPQMWKSPSRKQVFYFGLAMAGAFLSKFSSGLLFFVFPAVAVSMRFWPLPEQPTVKKERRAWRWRAWGNIAKATLWASLFVYFVYLILSWNEPTDSFSMIPHFPSSPFLRRMLMPIWKYLRGLIGFAFGAGSRPTYILGHPYSHGVWFYFPVLTLLKSPLAFLLLLALAIAIALVVKTRRVTQLSAIPAGMELLWRCLWVSLVIFTVACMLNRLDISIRHFSIPLALMILLLAPLPLMLESLNHEGWPGSKAAGWATIALVAGLMFTAIRAYPNYFPFLNTLSMGQPGYLLVNDSNLDWNQALPAVEAFVDQRGLKRILLDEYSVSDPHAYVPEAQPWSCQKADPSDGGQWAVVSANLIADGSNCKWLMSYPRQELAGGSMYAFQLPAIIPAAGAVGGPPTPDNYRFFGGMGIDGEDFRTIIGNCIRDPQQLAPTMHRFAAMTQNQKQH
jgi:4-amino-4-deoxy-L-arabinose transferase-like glycosyltransferase